MKNQNVPDYDSGWKDVITSYFKEFMEFFFINIHNDIDFDRGFVFLDKEFEKIVKKSKDKKRFVDKLVKVFLKDGSEKWLLIHIEIQGSYEKEFAKRMYIYNYRIYDRYKEEVITLAILTDENKQYIPDTFEIKRWGFINSFKFPLIKLIDYKGKIDLKNANNPFEIITFAHLKNIEVKKDDEKRLFWKIKLVKLLYQKGYKKEDVLNLYRFIDWIIVLPEELLNKFHEKIIEYEEEKKMVYVTTAERIGIKKGMEEGIERGFQCGIKEAIADLLDVRFKDKGDVIKERIENVKNIEKLKRIKDYIKTANNLDDVYKLL